jgi:hypothetical protein
MCALLHRVSFIICSSLILLTGCQTVGTATPAAVSNVTVPKETQVIVLAYDKNVDLTGLMLTSLPAGVEVLFLSDGNKKPKQKNGNDALACDRCNLDDIKHGKSCNKTDIPNICDAFAQSANKSTVIEHFDIYTTFGSCTKQVCPYYGYCFYISC